MIVGQRQRKPVTCECSTCSYAVVADEVGLRKGMCDNDK